MANDYAALIARVPKWLYAQNQSLVADMPQVIQQAQDNLVGMLSHDIFTVVQTINATPTGLLDLSALTPAALEVKGVGIMRSGRAVPIERRDYEMLSMLYPQNKGGEVRYYAESNGPLVLQLFPVPAKPAVAQVRFNAMPAYLSASVTTNALTLYAFRALEKATMRQAAIYMKDWAMADQYKAEMEEAITETNAQIARRRRDDTGQRPVETTNATGN